MSEYRQPYSVDLPSPFDPEDSWREVGIFDSRDEAIAYAMDTFGADENGRICVVSELPEEDIDQ